MCLAVFVGWCWLWVGCGTFLGGLFGRLVVGGISVGGTCVLGASLWFELFCGWLVVS